MKTNFFTEISKTGLTNMVIQIVKTENTFSVILSPKSKASDAALKSMVPILIKASNPEEIDEKFFDEIFKPLEKTSETFSNIEEYENSLAKAEKEKAENKKAAEAAKKAKEKSSKNKTSTDDDEDDEDCNDENCEVEKPKKENVEKPKKENIEKPKKDSPFKKFEDPLIEFTSIENFEITEENKSQLKDLVDKLLIMDKNNELGIHWEQKIKDFKKSLEDQKTLVEKNIQEEVIDESLSSEVLDENQDKSESDDTFDLFDFESFVND